ncbi:MAG: sulfatase-like hydrolase/transferase [Acidobacteria bacterium]|nr:sulfatase-like hydrolase/transferase [Acidobacteriota bacterium]
MKAGWQLIAFLLVSTLGFPQAARKPAAPDIYLITIDTLRADHLHSYGYDKVETPALDALASQSVRFTHAFTPSPITNTSHTTILTGLLPSHHGVTDFAVPLASSHATGAELLKGKGYHTAAFIGAVILDSKSLAPGLDRGFDFYDNFPENADPKSRWGRVERRGGEVVQHAEKWLSAHPAGPHFVWTHLYDPHDPYEPPAPFSETYKDRLYDGEIAYVDSVLAGYFAFLKKQGRYDNALIMVVGDHGEGLGEHGEETHGIFLYDATIHVPLLIKLPGKPLGKVIDAQVRTTDILPTALEIAGATIPADLDGESLKPYLAGSESGDRMAFGETDYPLRFGWAPLRSVRTQGHKYIAAPRPELYDLSSDPKELQNKFSAQEEDSKKLQEILARQGLAVPASAAAFPDPKDKIEEQNLLHRAMMAGDDNRTEDARAALEKVVQLDAKSPTALRQLGELELREKNYTRAAAYLKRAREVRPEDSTAAFYEGQALQKTGDLAGARDALEASLKLTPGQLPARLLLGNVYLGLNDARAAEDQFEASLLIDPESLEAQIGVAQAQMAGGNFAGAVQQLEPLAESHSDKAEVYAALAKAYAGLGKKTQAAQAEAKAKALQK